MRVNTLQHLGVFSHSHSFSFVPLNSHLCSLCASVEDVIENVHSTHQRMDVEGRGKGGGVRIRA